MSVWNSNTNYNDSLYFPFHCLTNKSIFNDEHKLTILMLGKCLLFPILRRGEAYFGVIKVARIKNPFDPDRHRHLHALLHIVLAFGFLFSCFFLNNFILFFCVILVWWKEEDILGVSCLVSRVDLKEGINVGNKQKGML